ncbi:MAG: carbon-nitrogen hydrolase family protein [Euryarchaeota archaeon]|nr:carbon-nitrogen hydrolase family protein [Euryarchaeota archaeon]
MKAILAQLEPSVGKKEDNLRKMGKVLGEAEADLTLFGELYLSGYMARDAIPRLAEPIDGPSVEAVQRLAAENGTHVVFGMPLKETERTLYNASVLVAPDGATWAYRKIYLANFGPFEENVYFGRGSELVLADTKIGKIGLLICYDMFFPELTKALVLAGAEVIAAISAAPHTSRKFFDAVLPARAIENAVYVLYANLVGTELNQVFSGGTQAIGPRGEDLGRAKDHHEQVVAADVDLRHLDVAREFRPTIRDTRPEFFEVIRRLLEAKKP